jgi:hypothetical protein
MWSTDEGRAVMKVWHVCRDVTAEVQDVGYVKPSMGGGFDVIDVSRGKHSVTMEVCAPVAEDLFSAFGNAGAAVTALAEQVSSSYGPGATLGEIRLREKFLLGRTLMRGLAVAVNSYVDSMVDCLNTVGSRVRCKPQL